MGVKKFLTFVALVGAHFLLQAQPVQFRDLVYNQVSFRVNTDGSLFENSMEKKPFFKVPGNGQVSSIYAANWWCGATLPDGDTATLVGTYVASGQETMPGPISSNYNAEYSNKYYKTWPMTVDLVNYHRSHYQENGYQLDPTIAEWPAEGRPGVDVGPFAPYHDFNNNGTYDPLNGDYPAIPGDMALFYVRNSINNQVANTTGGKKLKLALSGFIYGFYAFDGPLSKTVFIKTRVTNGGIEALTNLYVALWLDGDIGNSTDDFGGSIPGRNAVYMYNSDNQDEGTIATSYGENPPAQGYLWLNAPLSSAAVYNSSEMSEPFQGYSRYYNYLSGKSALGLDKVGGLYDFPGNPAEGGMDTEVGAGNAPGDRRLVAPTFIKELAPGEQVCLDGALVWAKGEGNNLENVTELDTELGKIQQFYQDFLGGGCDYYASSVNMVSAPEPVSLYPNPAKEEVFVSGANYGVIATIVVVDVLGKELLHIPFTPRFSVENLPAGLYHVRLLTKDSKPVANTMLIKE